MNAILGFSQLLERDDLQPRQRENVQQIVSGGRHLLSLINEVLDLASIEAGRLRISLEPVTASEVLAEVVTLISPLAAQKGIRLEDHVRTACRDLHVRADRQRLKQALLNLLSNAVKYNSAGGRVTVSCERQPHDMLRIRVDDTGPGISEAQLSRLFIPFERLEPENTKIEGTGLGLALTKRIVELMGGILGVESIFGEGSSFWLELPLTESPLQRLERDGGLTDNAPAGNNSEQIWTVLYIEDNLSNLTLMEQIFLERPQIQLVTAVDGDLGLELARQYQPDVILLDLQLPVLGGDKVLARLRQDSVLAHIPVVMISADATPGQPQRLLADGARAYLSKPFDIGELLRLLDRIFDERENEVTGAKLAAPAGAAIATA